MTASAPICVTGFSQSSIVCSVGLHGSVFKTSQGGTPERLYKDEFVQFFGDAPDYSREHIEQHQHLHTSASPDPRKSSTVCSVGLQGFVSNHLMIEFRTGWELVYYLRNLCCLKQASALQVCRLVLKESHGGVPG